MVVGTQEVDGDVGPTRALVQVVGDVPREVGRLPVGLDEDAVLVVAVVGGAQPHGAVGVEDLSPFAQDLDGAGHGARGVERVLVEEHVELGAEVAQALLDLVEHEVDAARAEGLDGLLLGQRHRVRLTRGPRVRADLLGDVRDVLPAVPVLGSLVAHGACVEGTREAVDLGAVVVEVVLARHLRPRGHHEAGEGVPHGGPAGTTQVDGPRGVRRDVLEVDVGTSQGRVRPEGPPALDDRAGQLTGGGRGQADVDEAGPRDLDLLDAFVGPQRPGEDARHVTRGHPGLLGHLHGDVGGPVPVVAGPGPLDPDGRGDVVPFQGEASFGGGVDEEGADEGGEFFGGHR